jgi:CheY-like chemotaxis protein
MPVIENGDHKLDVRLPGEPVEMLVDDERLSQVFANLLNNAAKYSDTGGRIEVEAQVVDGEARVAVRDSGIGLTGEQIANIFELFSQVDTAIERARGGLGIGLTLVQQLTEMHGGRVEVHSEGLGRGSEFRVCLPLRLPGAQEPDEEDGADARAPQPAARPCRALVVDDNRDSADTLAMMVELLGHEVRCLYDPHEVPAVVDEFAPDVVFLDVGMPGLSGYDLARVLRSADGGERLLLVAVTGWGQPEDRRRTRDAGFDRHLVKPADLAAIREICSSPDRAGAGT